MLVSYIEYTNRIDLTFALQEIKEFTWIKEKYKEIFINDIKYKNKLENILGFVPNDFDELLEIAKNNNEVAKVIENLCYHIYENYDDSLTLLSDISKNKLYIVSGTQVNYDARLENLNDAKKIYLLSPNTEDYIDLFGHKITFHIYNEFIN